MANGEELVSIRGLIEGAPRTPLKEFKGKLDAFPTELVTRFEPARTYVNLAFSGVEVIETIEPYPFPIAQIPMPLNKRRVSQWTVFSDSLTKFLPENQDIGNTIGMIYHMKITPGHMMWDGKESTPRESWEVIGLSGEGAAVSVVDATSRALELLDGKTEQEWNQLVFQDPAIKADSALMNDIIYRKFLAAQEAAGKITKDDNGVWHIKEG